MNRTGICLVLLFGIVMNAQAQNIPKELWGKWTIRRKVATTTIACWGDKQANGIIGSEIEYSADLFRWKNVSVKNPKAVAVVFTADQYHDEYSGGGANSSQVTFKQLGIKTGTATQITVKHEPAEITGATIEIPGDIIILKDKLTILFSVCGVYFEAERTTQK